MFHLRGEGVQTTDEEPVNVHPSDHQTGNTKVFNFNCVNLKHYNHMGNRPTGRGETLSDLKVDALVNNPPFTHLGSS